MDWELFSKPSYTLKQLRTLGRKRTESTVNKPSGHRDVVEDAHCLIHCLVSRGGGCRPEVGCTLVSPAQPS